MDIDVHALHHGFLRLLWARGGRLPTDAGVTALERRGRDRARHRPSPADIEDRGVRAEDLSPRRLRSAPS